MPLSSGARLGPYEIVAPLGVGGMGEVYRARDARLGREVALKVLREIFSKDAERMARFEREAQVLASLNHPNIAALYGLEESGGVRALVMELVEGPTLSERIAEGPMPLEEALPIARQIAEALEEAHEKGIIHRDLKPANVKVTPGGKVKVLDFGLAKALAAEPVASPMLSDSPTLTGAATREGVILGTAAYMSPEQARGKVVDKRSDIWSFGCILYELLSGRQAFGGETLSDSMAAIIRADPDWTRLPADTPAALRQLLRRCLQKDPKQRWHDIADARIDIDEAQAAPASPPPENARSRPRFRELAVAAVFLIAAAFAAGTWWRGSRIQSAPQWTGELLGGSAIAFDPRISPDGQTLAFQAMVNDLTQVAVMKPDSGNWTVLTRDRSRGAVQEVSWSPDGAKLYFDRLFDVPQGIFSVPVLGGEERLVLEDAGAPEALPDGSLLVVRINRERQLQLHRFWPEAGRLEALPAVIYSSVNWSPRRAFPDGKEIAFFGRPLASGSDPVERLYALELASGRVRRLAPEVPIAVPWSGFPMAIGPDGRSVLIDLPSGNLHRMVAVPRHGSSSLRILMSLTMMPWWIEAGRDGNLYVDQVDRPIEFLRFAKFGGVPERIAVSTTAVAGLMVHAVPFPDGRVLYATRAADRDRLLVAAPGKDPVPFLDTQEETALPATLVGEREVAFLAGTPPDRTIAVASLADGRITRRLRGVKNLKMDRLACSPDGKTLYYVASGDVWAIPSSDGEPRKIHAGDGVAVDPRTSDLIIQLNEKDGNHLVRVPAAGGPARAIPIQSELHLCPNPLAPNAVGKDGRILLQVSVKDSWYWPVGLLDPETGRLERVPVQYGGDMPGPGWDGDGRIVSGGIPVRAGIWRFRPVQQAGVNR